MKKKVRSVLLLALAVVMAIGVAGCGGCIKAANMNVAEVMEAIAPVAAGSPTQKTAARSGVLSSMLAITSAALDWSPE